MQLFDPARLGAPKGGGFNPKEKRRLLVLVALFVLLGGVVMFSAREATQSPALDVKPRADELPTFVARPVIDVASLEAAADDESPERRVVLPDEALDAGLRAASSIYDGVYEALDGRELDAPIAAEIVKDPKAHRGRLLRAHCRVEALRELANPAAPDKPRWYARGRLEDGAPLFFAAEQIVGLAPATGDFVRVDGLFVRAQREAIDGGWIEGPLLVGPRIIKSFPKLLPVTELDAHALAAVHDDSVERGFEGLEDDAYWELVSFVQHLDASKMDWTAAPMLDDATIASISEDGAPWRGKPVRLLEARMIDIWMRSEPGENPLRMERMAEGWFTRGDWRGRTKVARFVAPVTELPAGVLESTDVDLRAFFYKNLAYTKRDGAVAIAPFFVLHSAEKHLPPDAPGLRHMTYVVAGSLIVLGIGIVVVLRFDKAKSAELEAELLRRRRERRGKITAEPKP
ncbi:MAG TPA: hypothetical protein VM509_09240 [Planctomycetota bacterium]|nr:hypothetical protein [Planctomycetota bacterium]